MATRHRLQDFSRPRIWPPPLFYSFLSRFTVDLCIPLEGRIGSQTPELIQETLDGKWDDVMILGRFLRTIRPPLFSSFNLPDT